MQPMIQLQMRNHEMKSREEVIMRCSSGEMSWRWGASWGNDDAQVISGMIKGIDDFLNELKPIKQIKVCKPFNFALPKHCCLGCTHQLGRAP